MVGAESIQWFLGGLTPFSLGNSGTDVVVQEPLTSPGIENMGIFEEHDIWDFAFATEGRLILRFGATIPDLTGKPQLFPLRASLFCHTLAI